MAQYISMKQVPSGTVTAKDDRIVYDSNLADSGIIYGCEISYTGNNMIHINAGYGIIKGGLFEIEDHTEYVDLAEDANTTGQIYLHLDLSADDKLIIVSETTNNLHPMEQNVNANFEDGVYEFQLCTYVATTTALEDVVQTFSVVQSAVIDSLQEIAANTTGGLKAGALAVKELNSNLSEKTDALGSAYSTVSLPFTAPKDGDFLITVYPSGNVNYYIYVNVNNFEHNYSAHTQYANFHHIPLKKGDVVTYKARSESAIRHIDYLFR